jgi:glutamate-5-semialdehyde dehydrogenase
MGEILKLAKAAKSSLKQLSKLNSKQKNDILKAIGNEILKQKNEIKRVNEIDIKNGEDYGLSVALLDRLRLTDLRIEAMANGVFELANFADPIGEVICGWEHKNGMQISKIRVPLGVLGMIYESRPNVSIDAAALAIKSSNAVILRGSSNAINSNKFLVKILNEAGKEFGLPSGAISLITDTSRSSVDKMIRLNEFIDVLIPRGGKGLKEHIIKNATIPVIETGAGVCHIYVDESAKLKQAISIIKNAKTQRPSTCNSVECVILQKNVVDIILPFLINELSDVEFRLDEKIYDKFCNVKNVLKANESDFTAEFLDLILAVRVVENLDEAIDFINTTSTKHSDVILSQNYENIQRFLNEVDSAVVYANASTRFSDGGEFGFGGEIGISTQKLHARGPMGVRELTTFKYIVRGDGQIR